ARSLGYIVVGLNEYYTSKKCPDCENFVAQVTLRELYCPHCGRYHHRDVMAAENMSSVVRAYLENQKRPLYLQPKTADGRYPWEEEDTNTTSSSPGPSISSGDSSSAGAPSRGRKRTSSISNRPSGSGSVMIGTGSTSDSGSSVPSRGRKRTSSISDKLRDLGKKAREL
ncbi:hypothetical protein BGZ46_010782, partial [Entomortierella lignicola]